MALWNVAVTANLWWSNGESSSPHQHLSLQSTTNPASTSDGPSAQSSDTPQCWQVSRPVAPLKTRYDIARLCEKEGLTIGVELGLQNGNFAHQNLLNWPSCERYYMVDLWAPLEVRYSNSTAVHTAESTTLQKNGTCSPAPTPATLWFAQHGVCTVHISSPATTVWCVMLRHARLWDDI
jgi:hypothetical protein